MASLSLERTAGCSSRRYGSTWMGVLGGLAAASETWAKVRRPAWSREAAESRVRCRTAGSMIADSERGELLR